MLILSRDRERKRVLSKVCKRNSNFKKGSQKPPKNFVKELKNQEKMGVR